MSSPSTKAADEANRQEQQRQAAIQQSVGSINSVFDDPKRQGQIDDLFDATRTYLTDDLNKQKKNTDRSLKFAMARSGLTGGSANVDAVRRVGEDYTKGALEADRRAQAAAADLRTQDEQARLNLIAMAQSGLDATSGASQAVSAMRNNLATSQSTATAQGLGDTFAQFADLYRKSQDSAEERRTRQFLSQFGYYTPGFGQGGFH